MNTNNDELIRLFLLFLSAIHLQITGHGGHDEPEDESLQMPPLESNEHLYDLNGQVKQKVIISKF